MAKNYDHDIVRALETHLKAKPWKMQIGICVVMALKRSVKTYTAGSIPSYSCGPFYTINYIKKPL
jgi:hypothetical protein